MKKNKTLVRLRRPVTVAADGRVVLVLASGAAVDLAARFAAAGLLEDKDRPAREVKVR